MPSMPRNTLRSRFTGLSLAIGALLPVGAVALSTTNSDSADLVLADMALSRGDCRGGTDRYLKAAMATNDATISQRANKVASECQQIAASAKAARRWQKLEPRERRRGRRGGAGRGPALSTRGSVGAQSCARRRWAATRR